MYKSGKLGIAMEIKDAEGNEIEVGHDGKIGELLVGQSVMLTVVVEADDLHVISVDGKKNVVVRKSSSDQARVFPTNIHVHETGDGKPYTRYPENLVRLVKIGESGDVRHWEIALNVQNSVFWVTTQENYDIPCARDKDGKFLCPRFAHEGDAGNWPQMVAVLETLLKTADLPDHVAMGSTPGLQIDGELAEGEGVVRWWNCATQMGAISINTGLDVRVHWSQVYMSNGSLRRLAMNQRVTIETLRDIVVKEGFRPTGFKQEALGVRVVG